MNPLEYIAKMLQLIAARFFDKKGNNTVSVLANFSQVVWQMNVPITIQTNVPVYRFGNVKRLQDTLLQRLMIIVNTNQTYAPDGATELLSESDIDKGYLTLVDKNSQKLIDAAQLSQFKVNTTSSANNPTYLFPGFDSTDIDWEQSWVQFPEAVTVVGNNNKQVLFHIQYIWKKDAPSWQEMYGVAK